MPHALREFEQFYKEHRPHRASRTAARCGDRPPPSGMRRRVLTSTYAPCPIWIGSWLGSHRPSSTPRTGSGAQLPVEIEVLLVLDGPGTVTVWTAPTERVEATHVGRLTGAAVAAYETVLAELDRDLAPVAWLTANEVASGRFHAFVGGHPL
jgi:hypothetical protein